MTEIQPTIQDMKNKIEDNLGGVIDRCNLELELNIKFTETVGMVAKEWDSENDEAAQKVIDNLIKFVKTRSGGKLPKEWVYWQGIVAHKDRAEIYKAVGDSGLERSELSQALNLSLALVSGRGADSAAPNELSVLVGAVRDKAFAVVHQGKQSLLESKA